MTRPGLPLPPRPSPTPVPPLPHYGGRAPVRAPYVEEAPRYVEDVEPGYDSGYGRRWDGDAQHDAYEYDAHDYDAHDYDAYDDEQYDYDDDYDEPYQLPRTNTMSVLGLVFAFVFSPLGLIFSAIGLRQAKRRWERGRELALAGLVVSLVMLAIGALVVLLVLPKMLEAAEAMTVDAIADELSEVTGTEIDPGSAANTEAVAGACDVIMRALLTAESGMAGMTTIEEYEASVAGIRGTLEGAAVGSADAAFIADVQALSEDFQQIADAAAVGGDTTELERKAVVDSGRVGARCAMAGWTE